MEHILKSGDFCIDCRRQGLTRKLRYFHINLEEKILKCESDECIYPLMDDKDIEADSDVANNYKVLTELKTLADDGLKFIEELLIDSKSSETFLPPAAAPRMPDLNSNVEQFKVEEPVSASASDKSNILTTFKVEQPDVTMLQNESASLSAEVLNGVDARASYISKVFGKVASKTKNCSTDLEASTSSNNIPKAEIRGTALNNIVKAHIRKMSSHNIPKAQITRFKSAIKTHKNVATTKKSKLKPMPGDHVIMSRKSKLSTQKKPEAEIKTTPTGPTMRPLDLLQGFLKD